MKILLRPNYDKTGSLDCTLRALKKLAELDITPMMELSDAQAAGAAGSCATGSFDELLERCDLVLTIGGDGTILHAVQDALRFGKPLLGVNTGRLGFLAQLESDELDHLVLLRDGSFSLLERMMLEISIERGDSRETYTALNDLVVSRGDIDRLVEIDIRCEGNRVARHRADGMIFCTSTGSTAYNLSAGGSISDPDLQIIQMTAICPHSHFNHSLILSPEKAYEVRELPGNNTAGLHVALDGRRVGRLLGGERLIVRKARRCATFIDLGLQDFFSRVDKKLALGGSLRAD